MEENIKLRRRKDLTGFVFGWLTVIEAGKKRSPNRAMYWLCKCKCGTEKEISAQSLIRGSVVSCGCYNKEINSKRAKHGHNRRHSKKSPTYITWTKMNDRCNSTQCREYKWYGGRGVTICDRWKSYVNFLSDMGERPEGCSLDRIDVNGNYEPSNCRWVDQKTQANNTRRNVYITYQGITQTIAEWASSLGLKYETLYCRIFKFGMPVEKALTKDMYVPIPGLKFTLKNKSKTN